MENNISFGVKVLFEENSVQKVEETLSPEVSRKVFESRSSERKGPGRPRKEFVDTSFFRTTIIAHRENYEKLKVIAMKEGRPFKDILNDAFAAVIEKYEEKNGEVILKYNHENPFKEHYPMMVTESGKKLYSYDDVALLLGLSTQTLYKYVKKLELALYPISGRLYFEESQISQVAEKRKKFQMRRGK